MSNFSTALSFLKSGTAVRRAVRRAVWPADLNYKIVDENLSIFDKDEECFRVEAVPAVEMLGEDWCVYTPAATIPTTPRISDTLLSELLDYATNYGEVDENTPGTDTHATPVVPTMTGARRATILAYKELQQRRAAD